MKKHFYLILAMLILLVVSSQTTLAGDEYSNDFFVLKNGKIRTADNVIDKFFQNGINVDVTKNGVSSRLVEDFNVEECSGTASFELDGDRDPESGEMTGDILIETGGTCAATKHNRASQISRAWRGTFDGYSTFAVDPTDGSKRIIKGQINSSLHATKVVVDGVNMPLTSTATINAYDVKFSIDFPEAVLEGYTDIRPDSGARFSGMTGQVEWRADDDPDGWKLAKLNDKLPVYAHIRTQEDSSVILSFKDMSTFVLKPDSEVVIDTPPEKESKIKMVAGNIWVNIKKMVNEGSMAIEMNQAVAGIKGTTFVLSDDGTTSTLQVIEGEVSFTSKANGEEVSVVAGSMVSASSAGIGSVETFDTAKVTADWDVVASGDPKGLEVKTPDVAKVTTDADKDVVSGSAKEAVDFTSNGFLFLYGLIGVLAIFIVVVVIRKIKK